MDKIENIARIKTTDIKRLEMMRKRLGISGKFISECLGLGETSWSTWITQRGSIPEKHLDQIANIFQTIGNLKDGQRCLAVKPAEKKNTPDLDTVFEFLDQLINPKVPIFGDRCQALEDVLRRFSEEAESLVAEYTEK